MTLLAHLRNIQNQIEDSLDIHLTAEDFSAGWHEVEHIFLHEACHAAVAHCVPWVQSLDEKTHTAVDEVMARLLEMVIGRSVGAVVHSSKSFVAELQQYGINITQAAFDDMLRAWLSYFWLQKDLDGMAGTILTSVKFGKVIYHILPHKGWDAALARGVYAPESLQQAGFIHCSKIDQVLRSANLYFAGQSDLVLLAIAVERLQSPVRYEDLSGEGMDFPHIYGPLKLDAVVNITSLSVDQEGKFTLPLGLGLPGGSDNQLD